jgi:hypothetical protein
VLFILCANPKNPQSARNCELDPKCPDFVRWIGAIRFKNGTYTKYVSILKRIDELIYLGKIRGEIPRQRENSAIGRKMGV